jgi:transcriptional regulator with GAF, ATPase, and Fis domain
VTCGPQPDRAPSDEPVTLVEVERRHITRVLEVCHGRIEGPKGAASLLGLRPSTLRSRMIKLRIGRRPEPVISG